MGVKGLLPLLRSIQKPCNLKQFSGQTIGVDAYGWLHRGTISCAIELAQGKPTTKFVDFAISRVRMLIHFGVTPLLVFDGDYLPSKKQTEKDRAAKRRDAKAAGLELLQMGRTAQAYQELQKCIDVTPEMARQLMDELDKAKVRFMVAPYEADSQLVYLEKKGIIDGILSEDSDMLVFGAKTLLTKLDQYGECVAIHRKDFTACREISLVGWTDAEFRTMSILSGCDYLAPVGNVGLKTAYRLIRKHKTVDRVVKALQFDGKSKVPNGYLEAFRAAELTFLHQWVYCPEAGSLVNLTVLPADVNVEQMPFIGSKVPDGVCRGVAAGKLHPHTKEPLESAGASLPARFQTLDKALKRTTTPQLKKHQSIESFFKARRTPLAELDPNCFTPSPSQQRLLEQQQEEFRSAAAAPTPLRPPLLARARTEVQRPSSIRRSMVDTAQPSDNVSPKRQRLCSDSGVSGSFDPPSGALSVKSKFFSKAIATSSPVAQSPSVQQATRKRTTKKTSFNIWSDDSIEDAMASIPEPIEPPSQESKTLSKVFRDGDAPESATTAPQSQASEESQVSIASVEAAEFSQGTAGGIPCRDSLHETIFREVQAHSSTGAEEVIESVPCSSPPHPSHYETVIAEDDWKLAAESQIQPLPFEGKLKSNVRVPTIIQGSEDLIAPQSDSEEEALVQEPTMPNFGLNLGRFVFTG